MSSSGISATNSGPLAIRTYNRGSNKTFVLTDYDVPVPSNFALVTSTNGQLVPSNNIYLSSIGSSTIYSSTATVNYISSNTAIISSISSNTATIINISSNIAVISSLTSNTAILSSITSNTAVITNISSNNAYLSSIYSIGSTITFNNQVNMSVTNGLSLLVNGSTVFTEPGAPTNATNSNITIWGAATGLPISAEFTTTTTYTINSTISKINFQLIGAGGVSTFANPGINQDLPGYGAYLSGSLAVKLGDSLRFTIGAIGNNGSQGTSLVYISTTGVGTYVSTLVAVLGAGGGNGYASLVSSSSGGGHGGGGQGLITMTNMDYIALGTNGYDGISTVNGVLVSDTDGGQGGQSALGGSGGNGNPAGPGTNGYDGGTPNLINLLVTGGLNVGGEGGIVGSIHGGWGGGGYSGGGGGGASARTSAGGGGGATYIATSTLSGFLSNVVCLGGQFLANNNASPFGGDYGLPNNPGFALISGYSPNDTLYTNGDIQCRVLRYDMLDPPINAIGGAAALWALYPAIDTINMNDNAIIECGGLEVASGGIDVTGNSIFRNVLTASTTIINGNLTVNESTIINGGLTLNTNGVTYGALKIQNGTEENAIFIKDGTSVGSAGYSGYFVGVAENFGGPSTFQIGRVDDNGPYPAKAIYLTEAGNVGIGSSDPQAKLDVNGDINTSGTIYSQYLNITSTNTTGFVKLGVYNNTQYGQLDMNGYFTLYEKGTDNNPYVVLSSDPGTNSYFNNGNVGIGISDPQAKLDVNGTTNIRGALSTNIINMIQGQINGISSINGLPASDDIYWTGSGNNIYNSNSGNVGIGTNNPIFNLDVNGTARIGSAITDTALFVDGAIRIGLPSGNTSSFTVNLGTSGVGVFRSAFISGNGTNMIISNQQNGNLTLATNNSDKVTILPNGNVGIGTTNPQYTLDVNGTIKANALKMQTNGSLIQGTTSGLYIEDNIGMTFGNNSMTTTYASFGTTGAFFNGGITLNNNTGPNGTGLNINNGNIFMNGAGSITVSNGNITLLTGVVTAVDITATSDARLKTKVQTLENALSTVTQMRGVSYYPISSNCKKIGVIAQEIEQVLPEVVMTDSSPDQYKSVAYGNITGILIEAVKELSQQLKELSDTVKLLKNNNNAN
jgi:hypothetical protein